MYEKKTNEYNVSTRNKVGRGKVKVLDNTWHKPWYNLIIGDKNDVGIIVDSLLGSLGKGIE